MSELRLDRIAEKTKGKIIQGAPSLAFSKFNIDSRRTTEGELFFAIKARRNGHDFLTDAFKKGAAGAVISQDVPSLPKEAGVIKVKNTLQALQALARQVLREHKTRVVGITGSNGKTTTKEFASSLLAHKFRLLKSEGNYNNHLGLPLTMLKLEKKYEIAVLEMGMSGPGEIRSLTRIAPPDISVIVNINPVHLKFFKSLEDIALAKKEILEGTKKRGTAVLNKDDPLVRKIAENWEGRKVYFGLSSGCDVCARNVENKGFKGIAFKLFYGHRQEDMNFNFFYESYLYNLLAALGVAYALSLSFEEISTRISELKPFSMRGTLINLEKDIKLIDDSYNSNPKALESALKGLASLPSKRKIAVLGDMLELGESEIEYHIQAGKQVVKGGWDMLVGIGPLSRHMIKGALSSGMKRNQTYSYQSSREASDKILTLLNEGDLVLVKGSRGMRTEEIVNTLKKVLKRK
ncbi:MAG: UDP-N-acetylmuramoyl-tripeptide--D-alanyl-D-alanine ligase [Candidatus Aminicenantaceae bacterium]